MNMEKKISMEEYEEKLAKLENKMKLVEERYRILVETTHALLFEYTPETDIMIFSYNFPDNKERREILNYTEFLKKSPLVHPDHLKGFTNMLRRACERPISGELEYLSKVTTGDYQWHKTYFSSVADHNGKVISVLGRVHNTHESSVQMKEMINRMETDLTTGLYNKESAKGRIERWLLENTTGEAYMIMLYLNNFKMINDTYGHSIGDEILKEFSDVLQSHFKTNSIIARFGGVEFFIFIKGSMLFSVESQVDAFLSKLTHEFTSINQPLECSVGITTRQDRDDDFEDMFNRADHAMYIARNAGKNRYHVHG